MGKRTLVSCALAVIVLIGTISILISNSPVRPISEIGVRYAWGRMGLNYDAIQSSKK